MIQDEESLVHTRTSSSVPCHRPAQPPPQTISGIFSVPSPVKTQYQAGSQETMLTTSFLKGGFADHCWRTEVKPRTLLLHMALEACVARCIFGLSVSCMAVYPRPRRYSRFFVRRLYRPTASLVSSTLVIVALSPYLPCLRGTRSNGTIAMQHRWTPLLIPPTLYQHPLQISPGAGFLLA